MITLGPRQGRDVKFQEYTYSQVLNKDGQPWASMVVTYHSDFGGATWTRVKVYRFSQCVYDTDNVSMSPEELVAKVLEDINVAGNA